MNKALQEAQLEILKTLPDNKARIEWCNNNSAEFRRKWEEEHQMDIKKILRPILDKGEHLSIGRILLFLTFGLAFYKWIMNIDIPASHLTTLLGLFGYVFGTKVVDTITTLKK